MLKVIRRNLIHGAIRFVGELNFLSAYNKDFYDSNFCQTHSNTTIQQSARVNGNATAGFQLMGYPNISAEIMKMCTNIKRSD